MKTIDLRTEDQQKDGFPYYPAAVDCGNCGAHWHVYVPRKVALLTAAAAFECPRCGLVGSDVEGGHLTAVIPCGLSLEDDYDSDDVLI